VVSVDFDTSVKKVNFRFRGMQEKWNEWVDAESTRIAPHQAYTRAAPEKKNKSRRSKKKTKISSGEEMHGKASSVELPKPTS